MSNLTATKDDPLFTTYAAPLSRSEFLIDEGYQFKFFQPENGIDFETDSAGELGLAFKLDGEVRYYLRQMQTEPVLTTSYSDLVKYHYEPFEGIQVDVFFQVYSSRAAIQRITVTNHRSGPVDLAVYPFLHRRSGLDDVMVSADHRAFVFTHNEPPDGWTVAHDVPHETARSNVYLLSESPDAYGAYTILGSLDDAGPDDATRTTRSAGQLERTDGVANFAVEYGTITHADGSPCLHPPPLAQQIVLHNGSTSEVLTEEAPKWGDPDPNIPGNGWQGAELGNFRNPAISAGDWFSVIFTCLATGQQGRASGTILGLPAPGGIRLDIQLAPTSYPAIPGDIEATFSQDSTRATITWEAGAGDRYSVYRGSAGEPGRYDEVAQDVTGGTYTDSGLNADVEYAYMVAGTDEDGNLSTHSRNTAEPDPFFADAENALLYDGIPAAGSRMVAFQKTLALAPGTSRELRVIRAVAQAGADPDAVRQSVEHLWTYDMKEAVQVNEALYANVPVLSFDDLDREMMYWSAFSMMRQCMLPPEGQTSYNYNVYSREPTWGWGHAGQVFHENLAMLAYVYMDAQSAQESQLVFAERMGANPAWPEGFVPFRLGPYLNEVNYLAGEYSSSSPWFSYENWEIFQVSHDTLFLQEVYPAGTALYNFWRTQRDDDQDGLSEWGGHSFWESTSDFNVIWDILGGWDDPHNANKVEAVDLNATLVMEARALSRIADVLGKPAEAGEWRREAQRRADLINQYMWDEETHFYYHVEKNDHSFTYHTEGDLKRKELIGFEPLWAGVPTQDQAEHLRAEVLDPATFGRPYGMPLLAYTDPYPTEFYRPAVYVQRNYLAFQGLLRYGYVETARVLADRIFDGVMQILKDHHDFYETHWSEKPAPMSALHTYIWTGLVARMVLDLQGLGTPLSSEPAQALPRHVELFQNYPNPFNPATAIRYAVPSAGHVSLKVYDMLGREVTTLVDGDVPAGAYTVRFNGSGLATGVYFYRLQTAGVTVTRNMILTK